MSFTYFYTDYTTDKHIRSDEPQSATLAEIIECMKTLLQEPDNFIGIVDEQDVTLQFMVDDDGSIIVDLPVNDKNGSFTKSADLDACIAIVNAIGDGIVLDNIEGLSFKAW